MIGRTSTSAKGGIRGFEVAAIALIVLLTTALYLPFIRNPMVFDDNVFFFGNTFAYYALHPLGLLPRAPAYFTLAAMEVLFSRIEAHRIVSLAFHISCALALFGLTRALLTASAGAVERRIGEADRRSAAASALFAGGTFALHPASVYAAGYLVQRSVVLSTLCGLLSLWLLVRALREDRYAVTIAAAALYSVAVLSKEHSILLPALAVPLAFVVAVERRVRVRHLGLYLLACVPAALAVLLMMKQIVGHAYEPQVAAAALRSAPDAQAGDAFSWTESALLQMGLFFDYVALWVWPNPQRMAIDLRIDPLQTWPLAWRGSAVAAFAAWGAAGALLVRHGGRAAVAGFGMLYAWVLFLAELSVIRYQEPFVVYRSYLWAPGFLIAVAALLRGAGTRLAAAAFVILCPVLLYQAHDRLVTFSDPLRLWEDAAAKLPAGPVPWGSRVLYNLGREYLYARKPADALATTERCIADYPRLHDCIYARGAVRFQLEQYGLALDDFIQAASIQPGSGITQHRIGLALEKLGRVGEAKAHYRNAAALGYRGGEMELSRLGVTTSANPPGVGAKP